jgi:hypothetical protein
MFFSYSLQTIRCATLLFAMLLVPPSGKAQDIETQRTLIEGLRQRRLYDLADHVANEQIQIQDAGAALQASMAIELIKTQTARATDAPDDIRDQRWEAAHNGAVQFLQRFPNHPRKILVDVQQAMTWLTRGRLLALELQAGWGGEQKKADVNRVLGEAIQQLSQREREIEKMIPGQRRSNLTDDELSAEQLQALANNVRYQIAQAHRFQAMFFDTKLDIDDSLGQVMQSLDQLQRQVGVDDPLRPKIELDRATCMRLLGQYEQAYALLSTLQTESPDDPAILAEQLQLAIDLNNRQRAEAYLSELGQMRTRSAEIDAMLVQSLLALAALVSDKDDKQDFQNRAIALSKEINTRHGDYWGRRARMMLINIDPGTSVNSAEVKIAIAQKAYQQQQWTEAITAYRAAAKIAEMSQQADQAFAWYRMAAAIEQQQKQYLAAANAYRELALRFASDDQAGNVHLLGCWNLAQQTDTDEKKLAQYSDWLNEHINQFNAQPSSQQAQYWLAKLLAHQQKWEQAIDYCFSTDLSSPHFAPAMELAAQCSTFLLQTTKSEADRDAKRSELVKRFTSAMSADLDQPGTEWSESDRQVILAAANLAIDDKTVTPETYSRLLSNALASSDDASVQWTWNARLMLFLFLAQQQNRSDDLSEVLASLENSDQAINEPMIQQILYGLMRIDNNRESNSNAAKILAYELAQKHWDKIDDRHKTLWRLLNAQAQFNAGQEKQALEQYQTLADEHRTSITIQLEYARKLVQSQTDQDVTKSLAQWRRIAAGTKKYSEVWFESKYQVARLLQQSGQRDQALKMLQLIKLVPPGWSESTWNEKLNQLLSELEK